jgi:hypothetical protein
MSMFSRYGKKKRPRETQTQIAPILPLPFHVETVAREIVQDIIHSALTNQQQATHEKPISSLLFETPLSKNAQEPTKRRVGVLPQHYEQNYNCKMWRDFLDHLNRKKHQPILVWGPTGCGKTYAVKECIKACGMRLFEIEPSLLDSTEKLQKWCNNILSSKTLLGPRAIVIDVIEGFDESFIRIFESILKKQLSFSIPLVFIADTLYNLQLKSIFGLIPVKFRILPQNDYRCAQFAKATFAKHKSIDLINKKSKGCNGNLRKLKYKLNGIFYSDMDESLSLFTSTQDMLMKKLSVEKWTKSAEKTSLCHLIYENYPNTIKDIEHFCQMSDTLTLNMCNSIIDFEPYIWGAQWQLNHKDEHMKMSMTPKIFQTAQSHLPSTSEEYLLRFSRLHMPELLKDC